MLMPNGPRAYPSFGFGLAVPANAKILIFDLSIIKLYFEWGIVINQLLLNKKRSE
jgi:hypothetical protein